jgi:peptide/nickel transport system ATP-binding protein
VLSIGEQVAESAGRHGLRKDALARAIEMLKLVQIPNAAGRADTRTSSPAACASAS